MTTQLHAAFSAMRTLCSNAQYTPLAKTGTAILAGGYAASRLFPEEQKNRCVTTYVSLFHRFVDPELIPSREVRGVLWSNYQSGMNVIASSPVFYGLYHLIHRSGLPLTQHVSRAFLRGCTGTLATVPAFAVMYAGAAVILPGLQAKYMQAGLSRESAKSSSEATVFLGLAAPLEFAAEATGCGVTPAQMRSRLAVVATGAIVLRLLSGVLVQYRAVDAGDTSCAREYIDLAKTVAGTTVSQHVINGCMQSLSNWQGSNGLKHYLRYGNTSGIGMRGSGLNQLLKTAAQRTAFGFIWNELSHRKTTPPSWVTVEA